MPDLGVSGGTDGVLPLAGPAVTVLVCMSSSPVTEDDVSTCYCEITVTSTVFKHLLQCLSDFRGWDQWFIFIFV